MKKYITYNNTYFIFHTSRLILFFRKVRQQTKQKIKSERIKRIKHHRNSLGIIKDRIV